MWRQWGKSTVKIRETGYSSSAFSFSSFKDIQHLCSDDPSPSTTTRTSAVFRRVRLANSIIRSFSPPLRTKPDLLLESNGLPAIKTAPCESEDLLPPPQLPKPDLQPEPERNGLPVIKTAPLECREVPPLLLKSDLQLEPEANGLSVSKTAPLECQEPPPISIPGAEKRVVVYSTSLRVVRSTFENCRSVKSILQGFHVSIDERDLSMDSRFIKELQQIFGGGQTKLTLPRVFIGGRYIGGADEIRELHEAGELKKFVQGLPAAEPGVCSSCGGYRFLLCHVCYGSHKLYMEKSGFKSCVACNENGLNRCPSCSCAPF